MRSEFTPKNTCPVDLNSDKDADRIAVVRNGSVSYLPARRVELVDKVGGAGHCRYIRRSRNGDLYVTGPGIQDLLLRSSDAGVTWSRIPCEIVQPGFMSAFTILRDDTFVACIMPSNIKVNEDGWIARSGDCGRTWRVHKMGLDLSPHKYVQGGNSDLLELEDGTLLLTLDVRTESRDDREVPLELRGIFLYLFRSRDGGRTWPGKDIVTMHGAESHLLELPSGKLLACIRKQRGHRLPGDPVAPLDLKRQYGYRPEFNTEERAGEAAEDTNRIKNTFLSESLDDGRTWIDERCVSSFLQCSAELTLLPENTLVLQFLHRYADDLAADGVRAKVSDDQGLSWRDETYVISQGNPEIEDSGSAYPGGIAMPDGTLITTCVNWVDGRTRLEAVHWRPLPKRT